MTAADPTSTSPTRVRYSVLLLLCTLAMITYLDRAMYGSAKKDLMEAVGQPESQFFWVLTFFQLAYALFEIPTGWLGDRYGPRAALLRVVAWWSMFVGLTAFAGLAIPGTEFVLIGFTVLVAMQFLFGMGEAGAFPNISKAVYNWFPGSERGFAQGAVWMSARLAGGLTPAIWVVLTVIVGLTWRETLWVFAGIALFWCLIFAWWFRNRPEEHSAVNAAEAEAIRVGKTGTTHYEGTPWRKIFLNPNVWALCAMYSVTNFNWYFLMYYLPGTLKAQFPEMGATQSGLVVLALLGGAPLLVGMLGCYWGGVLTDRYIRWTGDRKWGRRLFGMLGYSLAGGCYLTAAFHTDNLWVFATCLILVGLMNDLIMAPSWATAQDIGQKYSAIVSGTMNMIGNLGAALGNFISGLILAAYTVQVVVEGQSKEQVQSNGYVVCFVLFASVYALGVLSWLLIDPTKPIVKDESTAEPSTES